MKLRSESIQCNPNIITQVGQADAFEDDVGLHEGPGGDYSEQAMAKAASRNYYVSLRLYVHEQRAR